MVLQGQICTKTYKSMSFEEANWFCEVNQPSFSLFYSSWNNLQDELGGSLLDLSDLFPTAEDAKNFLNFNPTFQNTNEWVCGEVSQFNLSDEIPECYLGLRHCSECIGAAPRGPTSQVLCQCKAWLLTTKLSV